MDISTCVNSDVRPEVVSASEGPAAPLALVTLLPSVPSDVVHQSRRVGETPTTDVAFVRFFS